MCGRLSSHNKKNKTKRPWIKREPDTRLCPICQKMINNILNRYFCSKQCESSFRTGLAFTANPDLVISCKLVMPPIKVG